MKHTETLKQLNEEVKGWVETLENKNINIHHVLEQDVLDTEFRYDSSGKYSGAELTVTHGGPTVTIDTKNQVVTGTWAGERVQSYYEDVHNLQDLTEGYAPHTRSLNHSRLQSAGQQFAQEMQNRAPKPQIG